MTAISRRAVIAATAGTAGAVSVGGVALAAPASADTDCGSGPEVRWPDLKRQLAAVNPQVSAPNQKVVTNKYTPGMLLGNGDIGVVAGDSSATQQTFHFGKSDFWGNNRVFQHTSAHEGGDDTNPNLDLGFARKVINTLLDTSVVLGVDADLRPVWKDFLSKLSAYPTGTYNGVTVFFTGEVIDNPSVPDTFEPGNQPINMEGVIFPGEQCSIGGDPMLLQYAINSLTQMNSWGVTPGGNSNNGFCKEFVIAARVGWPAEDLVQKLKASIAHLWRPSSNTVFQGGGGVETTGTTEALNSMLMQSEHGVIRVFPCWPAARDASFTLQAKGAFLVSAEQRAGAVDRVRLHSRAGGDATLQLPWNSGSARVLDESRGGRVAASVSGGRVTFRTTAGRTYRIEEGR